MDPITQALATLGYSGPAPGKRANPLGMGIDLEALMRAISPTAPVASGVMNAARPVITGYVPDPAMPPASVPPQAPAPAGLLSAPPSPGAAPPAGPMPAQAPQGLLGAPQPLSPMLGAPQPVSPLVSGGGLPAMPSGGLPPAEAEGGGLAGWLEQHPEVSRGLLEMGMRMMGASAPSLDPKSGSLAYAASQGLGGFMKGTDDVREQKRQERADAVNEAYKLAIAAGDGSIDLQKFYDDQGREVMGYWDAGQGRMVQVGGAKAPTGRGGGAGGAGSGGTTPTTLSGSLTTKDKQIINAIPSLRGAVDAYESALANTDAGWFDRAAAGLGFAGPEAVKLEALRTQVIMQLKELQGLGAPQAGDLKLLEAQLSDPASIWSLGRGPEGFKEQLNAIRALSDTIANSYGVGGSAPVPATSGTYGVSADAPVVSSDEEYEALPSGAEFIGDDGKRYRKP